MKKVYIVSDKPNLAEYNGSPQFLAAYSDKDVAEKAVYFHSANSSKKYLQVNSLVVDKDIEEVLQCQLTSPLATDYLQCSNNAQIMLKEDYPLH